MAWSRSIVALVVATSLGCAKSESADRPPPGKNDKNAVDKNAVVARIDGRIITVADIERRLGEQPPQVRARYQTPAGRRELLDNLVRFEVLVQEAKRQGYERDPEIVRFAKQRAVDRMIAEEIDRKLAAEDIPKGQIRASVLRERRARRLGEWTAELRKRANIRVHEENLRAVSNKPGPS